MTYNTPTGTKSNTYAYNNVSPNYKKSTNFTTTVPLLKKRPISLFSKKTSPHFIKNDNTKQPFIDKRSVRDDADLWPVFEPKILPHKTQYQVIQAITPQPQYQDAATQTETKTDYKLFIESAIADAKKVGLFTRIIEAISSFFSSSGRDAKKRQFRKKLLKLSIPVSPNEEDEIIKKCKEFNFGDTSKILITQVEIKYNNGNNNQIQIESHHFRDKASQTQNITQNTI